MDSELKSLLYAIGKVLVTTLETSPVPSLAVDVPASRKAGRPKKEETILGVSAAAQQEALPFSVEKVKAVEPPFTKEQDEAAKQEALATASAFVRRFAKAVPDGMVRAKALQAEKFGGKTIAQLGYGERVEFTAILKKQMEEPVGAAA